MPDPVEAPQTDPVEGPQTDPATWWYNTWVDPYLSDPSLWPTVFALAGHAMILFVPILLVTIRTRHPVAFVLLLGVLMVNAEIIRFEWRIKGGPKGLAVLLALMWMGALGLTWLALQTGFL